VSLLQLFQVSEKFVPLDVSIAGNEVRDVQLFQALVKLVPEDVSMTGKLFKLVQNSKPYE
jgi:Ni,Fe-hydrogenase III small subunit